MKKREHLWHLFGSVSLVMKENWSLTIISVFVLVHVHISSHFLSYVWIFFFFGFPLLYNIGDLISIRIYKYLIV